MTKKTTMRRREMPERASFGKALGLAGAACLAVAMPSSADKAFGAASPSLRGVNMTGAAYSSGTLPGRYGYNYIFPNDAEIPYYIAKGVNVFRLSVSWERLQPQLNGTLDADYLGRIQHFVAVAEQRGASTIIDVHNYGRYGGTTLGTGDVNAQAFADLWRKIAQNFGRDSAVIFGLMNEPQVSSATTWAGMEQQAIDAIRQTNASNEIFVSGVKWDSAMHFPEDNGAALATLHDPRNALIFEVHEYFDAQSSGTSPVCIAPSQVLGRLSPFTSWLSAHHARGFLGEFGVSTNSTCLQDLKIVANYLAAQTGQWKGATYWAGGPWLGNYMYSIEPLSGDRDQPQMSVLSDYFAGTR